MKTTKFAVLALGLLGLLSSAAFAEGKTRVVTREQFNIHLYPAGIVTCRPGLASDGHNYPLFTYVDLKLAPYDFWGHAYFNSKGFRHRSAELGDFCSEYEHLTKMPNWQAVTASVKRQVEEGVHFAKKDGKLQCLRSFREEMQVTIEGVAFDGVTVFDVGIVDAAQCE